MKSTHTTPLNITNDWRLPNHKELMSLLESACASPMLNVHVFPDDEGHPAWSSTTDITRANYAWAVNLSGVDLSEFIGRYSSSSDKALLYTVRLVRNVP